MGPLTDDLDTTLHALRNAANTALEATLNDLDGPDGRAPTTLAEAMRYAVLGGGKRFRPTLALAACEAVGGPREAALPIAVALELIHAYSLVHDDLPCMDDDDERRGKPTVHVRYGEARAVLTGDALLTEAFRVLGRPSAGLAPEARLQLILLASEAAGVSGMVGGQEYDIAAETEAPDTAGVLQLHAMKTGALFRAASVGGGISGGASPDALAALDRFGRSLGAAFQLTDDLLDLQEFGGERTGDPHEDAVNLAVTLGVETCRQKAAEQVAAAIDAARFFGPNGGVLEGIARRVENRET
jgi:geranylgeranyl pyrophosphate synthase